MSHDNKKALIFFLPYTLTFITTKHIQDSIDLVCMVKYVLLIVFV